MKHTVLKLLIILFFFTNVIIKVSAKKIALISAISNYKNVSQLHTEKDVSYIKNTLLKQGFLEENIIIITNEQVTKNQLIKIFRTALINKAEKGDVVLFHFSGHGQQIIDINNDEADGYDEALVCYNAEAYWEEEGYKGEEHFTDDDLSKLLNELRIKIGSKGSVLVMIDACYSGTISRGNETIRGNRSALAPSDYNPSVTPIINLSSGIEFNNTANDLAQLIVFSASKQDEPNYETITEVGESIGSLSYAFSKTLNSNKNIQTYRGLFEYMKLHMSISVPNQTPLAEGDVDAKLFGGKTIEFKDYFKIKKVTDTEIILDAGKISGIYEGTVVGLYPFETKKRTKNKIKVKATVIKALDFESIIKLENTITKKEILSSWVFVEEKSYGDMKVNVFLCNNMKNRKRIINIIEKHPVIRIINKDRMQTADIIIKDSIAKYGENLLYYEIKNDNNKYLDTMQNFNFENVANQIQKQVLSYSKARYLRELELHNPDMNVKLELLPVQDYENENGGYIATEYGTQADKTINGQVRYKEGELFIFKIENKGWRSAYFQIIDIQPNNNINILIPNNETPVGDVKIEGGQTIIFKSKIMQIGYPFGTDMFKIIASPQPLYKLRNIIENIKTKKDDVNQRGAKSPFEILAHGISTGTRGASPFSIPVKTINIYSVLINTFKK